jgi:two-component system nitrate/nitrite response regulator NarL
MLNIDVSGHEGAQDRVSEESGGAKAGPEQEAAGESMVSTFVVEPSVLVREGLREIFRGTSFDVVGAVSSFNEISRMGVAPNRQALLLLDGVEDHEAALSNAQVFRAAHPGTRIVVLVDSYEVGFVFSAYEAGIDAYLSKSLQPEVLRKTLELVMLGQSIFPSSVLDQLRDCARNWKGQQPDVTVEAVPQTEPWDGVDRRDPKGLSVREILILRCLMDGDSNKVIARKCDIAEATVKVHVKTILRKIKAKNRTQAALWATAHLPRIERRAGWRRY